MKYSVLMSIYKDEKPEYFKASIDSMLKQTIKPDQIVIVKDGALTTKLDLVIEYYKGKYSSIFTIVPLEKNVGLGLALNAGLETCRNEFVARMDTDDISKPERCEKQLNIFKYQKNLSIIGSIIGEFFNNPNEIVSRRVVPEKHQDILEFSRRRNPFNHPSVMYKKSEVLKSGGYKDFRRNQDLDLFVRMLVDGCLGYNIQEALVLFRANEDNLKRRKSWIKCSSYIKMIYSFWRQGHSKFSDFLMVLISQLVVYISPTWFLNWLSNSYLRN